MSKIEKMQELFDMSCIGLMDQKLVRSYDPRSGGCCMMDKNENRCAVGQLLPKEIIIDFNLQYESQMIFIDQIFDLYEISAEDQYIFMPLVLPTS